MDSPNGTYFSPGRQRREAFFQSDWRSKNVEQLSQLLTARHASGLERKHLGQMFYNKCFTALPALPGRGDSDLQLKHSSNLGETGVAATTRIPLPDGITETNFPTFLAHSRASTLRNAFHFLKLVPVDRLQINRRNL